MVHVGYVEPQAGRDSQLGAGGPDILYVPTDLLHVEVRDRALRPENRVGRKRDLVVIGVSDEQ